MEELNAHAKYDAHRLRDAETAFRDHVATRHDLGGGVIVIDWARPNSSMYSIRYLFDTMAGNLTISGDLGYCVVHTTWGAVGMQPERVAASFSHTNLHYFNEKLKACENRHTYDEDSFRHDVKQWLRNYSWDIADKLKDEVFDILTANDDGSSIDADDYVRDKAVDDWINEMADGLAESFACDCGLDVNSVDDDLKDTLASIDTNWKCELYDAGREYDAQLYYWVIGLRKAIQSLSAKDRMSEEGKEGTK